MLDAYYSNERALPAEYAVLYRLCRAMSKPEQAAVQRVADEFFEVGEDGLRHNSRADKDIVKALKRINAVRKNGTKGGRPPKPDENLAGFSMEPNSPPSSPHMVKPPDPRPHAPKVKNNPPSASPPEGVLQETWDLWLKHKGKKQTEAADRLQRKHLAEWAAKGHDPNAIVERSIANGYAGLVEPKSPGTGPAKAGRAKVNEAIWGNRKADDDAIDGTAERVA